MRNKKLGESRMVLPFFVYVSVGLVLLVSYTIDIFIR